MTRRTGSQQSSLRRRRRARLVASRRSASPSAKSVARRGKSSVTSMGADARLSNFEEMQLTIVMGLDTAPKATTAASSTRSRRLGTTRNKQTQLNVTKQTSVKDIKLELYPVLGVGPLHQQLYYQGRELGSDETVGSIGLLAGDHLNVVEIVEVEDFEAAAGEEGFGGTALVGRLGELAWCHRELGTGSGGGYGQAGRRQHNLGLADSRRSPAAIEHSPSRHRRTLLTPQRAPRAHTQTNPTPRCASCARRYVRCPTGADTRLSYHEPSRATM